MLQTLKQPISAEELRQRVYRGEILHFQQQPSVLKLCRAAQRVAESVLDTSSPQQSHQSRHYDHWLKQVYRFQLKARSNPTCLTAFNEFITSIGLQLAQTYCDKFIFRVVPPINAEPLGSHAWVDTHRDTWGAGIYQQINWWGPLYDYEANTGIEFYPDYFDQPIANTTKEWRYQQYAEARKQCPEELKPPIKSVPSPDHKPGGQVFRPQIEPGDLLCFSAAHLHGSSANQSDSCRFSFETRTLNLDDVASGLQAPNVDNASSGRLCRLFKNMADGSVLSDQQLSVKSHIEREKQ